MRVLVIGSGGREHVLAYKLAVSPHVSDVCCAPGNAGTASVGVNVPVMPDDHDGLVKLARDRNMALTIVGPEAPLCAGIVDRFESEGLRIFGPTAAAARLEGDKAFAKRLLKSANVPTASARIFDRFHEAKAYVASRDDGVVVKASGLAAGKGVSVCPDPADALLVLERMMVQRVFGDAGQTVVVEELLKGEELSVFALVDDRTIYVLETAQDHKAIGDGDTGPNTGGMGAFSPAPIATPEIMAKVERDILVPIVDAMRQEGCPYRGLLYVGLMLTAAGPKVLEFNCRFGDPETQPLLMRLESDLFELLDATAAGRLDQIEVQWSPRAAVCVVMASQGYPDAYETGKEITGLDRAAKMDDVIVFHAGTKRRGDRVLSSGGRVLGVTALGDSIEAARKRAYEAVNVIHFENAYYRKDIGVRATRGAPAVKV